jgi:hypothetical protein
MNKFSKIVLGLKALLGQKAPSSAVTDNNTQLDWDNHAPSEEEQAIWEEMAFGKPVTQFRCGECQAKGNFHWAHNHACETATPVANDTVEADPFQTCTVCNNDKFVGQTKVEVPFVCGGCQDDTRYHKALMKTEKEWQKKQEEDFLNNLPF